MAESRRAMTLEHTPLVEDVGESRRFYFQGSAVTISCTQAGRWEVDRSGVPAGNFIATGTRYLEVGPDGVERATTDWRMMVALLLCS